MENYGAFLPQICGKRDYNYWVANVSISSLDNLTCFTVYFMLSFGCVIGKRRNFSSTLHNWHLKLRTDLLGYIKIKTDIIVPTTMCKSVNLSIFYQKIPCSRLNFFPCHNEFDY